MEKVDLNVCYKCKSALSKFWKSCQRCGQKILTNEEVARMMNLKKKSSPPKIQG